MACLLLAGYFLLESIMLMVALWVASQFGIEPLPEQSLLKLLVSVYTGMNVVLVGTTMTLAIVAIIELVQSRRIIWACRYATIFSGLMLGFLFLCSVLVLLTPSSIPGSSDFDAGQRAAGISVTIVMYILIRCFAPTVIGIVGIIRMFAKI